MGVMIVQIIIIAVCHRRQVNYKILKPRRLLNLSFRIRHKSSPLQARVSRWHCDCVPWTICNSHEEIQASWGLMITPAASYSKSIIRSNQERTGFAQLPFYACGQREDPSSRALSAVGHRPVPIISLSRLLCDNFCVRTDWQWQDLHNGGSGVEI